MVIDEPVVYQNFIDEIDRLQLKEYAIDLLNSNELKTNHSTFGDYRKFKSFYSVEELNAIHKKLYYKICNFLHLENEMIDPKLGMIISVIKPGGYIHNHIDRYPNSPEFSNKRNFRFNVMIERGEDQSYNPIIDQRTISVNKCDAWCFVASKYEHETSVISGPEKRIVYQFGFMIDRLLYSVI